MKAIVLAGGFATRLWPLTEKTAKPLLEVSGRPILSYILESLPEEIPVIVSTNSVFGDDFSHWKEVFSTDHQNRNIEIFIEDSHHEEKKKGALAAVALVLEKFGADDDLLVLAGDNLFFFDFTKFLDCCLSSPLIAAYDIQNLSQARSFGVLIPGEENTVSGFQEKPEAPQSTLVSTGCLYFPQRLLGELVRYSQDHNDNLGGVFEHFLHIHENVEYFQFHEQWFDIGSFPTLLEAQKLLIGQQTVNAGADIKGRNSFSGSNYLGKNVVIENALLENVIVHEGGVIRNACVRDSIVGKHSVVTGVDISKIALREESFVASE